MSDRRLDTVLRIRRLQEQLAGAEVARSRRAAASAEQAERHAWQLVADRTSHVGGGLGRLLTARQRAEGGIVHARRLGDATATAQHHADLALDDWRRAMQRLDGVERLGERIESARRAERERREHTELDDLVVMRWNGDAP